MSRQDLTEAIHDNLRNLGLDAIDVVNLRLMGDGHELSDCEHEVTPQTDSLHDSNVNYALIAIAQEVAELLKQSYPVQADEIDGIESITGNSSAE